MAGPMFLLYWVGIFGAKCFGKKKPVESGQAGVSPVAMAVAGAGAAGMSAPKSSGEDYVGVPGGRGR
jgi:sec-independent protein translocase protein TatC